ncbi:MAG: hypothetical protein A2X23_05195 [Chloroflexi bacterium GWC2_73_18]|nr:MAG: hypothetical protein A2X23_05195 [Chloroflexi bacterium GWC2_73_18]
MSSPSTLRFTRRRSGRCRAAGTRRVSFVDRTGFAFVRAQLVETAFAFDADDAAREVVSSRGSLRSAASPVPGRIGTPVLVRAGADVPAMAPLALPLS